MPVPIFKINVDDTAFKNFLKTFNKYQESLNEQPENWKGINDEIATSVTIAASLSAEIAHQFELTRELMKLERDHDKQQEKIVSKRRKEMKSLLEDAKSFGSAAMGYGGTVIKYAAGAITGGARGGYWGLDKLGGWAGDQRRAAMGLGVSVGSQQRANVALSRYFNVNSALENIANLKASPEGQVPFGVLGIRNVQGKDPAQLLYEVAQAAGQFFGAHKGPGQMAVAQAAHLTDIFSPNELRVLAQVTRGELGRTVASRRSRDAALGLTDETGRKWQDFSSTLEGVGYKLKDVFAEKLVALEGPLGKVTDAFAELITKVVTKTNLDAMAKGINGFADYLSSGKFQQGFDHFLDEMSKVGEIVDWIWDKVGPKKTDPRMTSTTDPRDPRNRVIPSDHAGSDQKRIKSIIASGMLKAGYPVEAVKGDIGNVIWESGLDPLNMGPDKKGTHYGLWQFDLRRQKTFEKLKGYSMQSIRDPYAAAAQQEWFHEQELAHKYIKTGKKLKQLAGVAGGASKAATLINNEYEVSSLDPTVLEQYARQRARTAEQVRITVLNGTGGDTVRIAQAGANGT